MTINYVRLQAYIISPHKCTTTFENMTLWLAMILEFAHAYGIMLWCLSLTHMTAHSVRCKSTTCLISRLTHYSVWLAISFLRFLMFPPVLLALYLLIKWHSLHCISKSGTAASLHCISKSGTASSHLGTNSQSESSLHVSWSVEVRPALIGWAEPNALILWGNPQSFYLNLQAKWASGT